MNLKHDLQQIWENDPQKRNPVVELLKQRHHEIVSHMEQILNTSSKSGLEAMYFHADAFDEILCQLMSFLDETVFDGTCISNTALIAVGGYGRKELAPYSDIDILFLTDETGTQKQKELISFATSLLWDTGLKIGAAVRSTRECIEEARKDMSIRTNLLENRLIWGNEELFDDFCQRYDILRQIDNGRDFVQAKLTERRERHQRMGLSKYMLEPNVKEGRGGLRDLHLMFWLAKYLFGITDMHDLVHSGILSPVGCHKFLKAHCFLSTVRCHLHILNERGSDILTFDAQTKIAAAMGYFSRTGQSAAERFMKHYYLICKTVEELSRQITVAITDISEGTPRISYLNETADFHLINDRIAFKDHLHLNENPLALLQAFVLKQRLKRSINPQTLQLIADNAKLVRKIRHTRAAKKMFFEILLSPFPESSLRQMAESGILGYLIPEFQNIVAQVQFDLYHVYTTDEHTFKTIGFLSETEEQKMPQSKRVLYLAALLHDIGKGRGGEHEKKGAELAKKIVTELDVDNDDAETVVWLVANHLVMSQTAFRRDIFDPKTIRDFVEIVQSPERLKLLYALTLADIKAVGPNVWNSFKAKLLEDLFTFALEKMQGENNRSRLLTAAQKEMVQKAPCGQYAFSITTDNQRGVSEFIVLAPDHDGLFAEITGAMALEDVSVVEAQILTLDNGMALDTFLIQETNLLNEKKPLVSVKKIRRLQNNIQNADPELIEQKLKLKRTLTKAQSVLWTPPRVFINNTASDTCTLIEINGTDCIGFLHAVTRTMTSLDLKIVSAHVYTYGSRIVDVFYLTNTAGKKITDPDTIQHIKTTLLDTINASTRSCH